MSTLAHRMLGSVFALAWLIASEWEHHKKWMSEQLEVVGGLA